MSEPIERNTGAWDLTARWRVTLMVALLSFSAMLAACYLSWLNERELHRRQFQARVDSIAMAISTRIEQFEVALEMGRGLFIASNHVSRDEWRKFTASDRFFRQLPGAYAFVYVQRVSRGGLDQFLHNVRAHGTTDFEVFDTTIYEPVPYDDYCVILYAEPIERNHNAIGLNVASVPASAETMAASVEHDRMAVSRRLMLQQTGAAQAGIVLYLPVYERDAELETVEDRWDAVIGWVAITLAMDDFLLDQWSTFWNDLDVVLCEGSVRDPAKALFVSPGAAVDPMRVLEAPRQSGYHSTIRVGQWEWVLYSRDPDPHVALWSRPVIRVGLVGGLIGLLLVLLTWSLARTRDRARQLADELTTSLRQSEQRYALAVRGSSDGLWDWDLTTRKVYYAPRWKELLGLKDEEVGDDPQAWFSRIVVGSLPRFHAELTEHIEGKTDRFDIEIEMLHADGGTRWMLCRGAAVRDGSGRALRLAGSMADITDLKKAQQELHVLAHHDRLTGLANRTLLTDRLTRAIARNRRNAGYRYALLFLDFDRFKVINDSLGHGVGDRLLVAIAGRIRKQVREVDTVARFGGDEFVILLDGIKRAEDAGLFAERLLEALSKPFDFEACEVTSTVSIGVVDSDHHYENAEDVLRDADAAMYQAKAAGRARYCLFDEQMHTQAVRRLKLEQDLRSCDFSEQFLVYYQPIISLDSGEITGFEALLRWEHPEHGRVGPDEFICIAEETGLIVELGEWVLNQALDQIAIWRRACDHAHNLCVNVNLSKRQLIHTELIQTIRDSLDRSGIPAQALKLEVTESTVMDSPSEIVDVMRRIREMGVRLAMDDFGTGHSSLSCLHEFPIDQIKIDRGFIVNMQQHREFAAVMDAIVTLAHYLHLEVVAEGIENHDQLAQLQAMDCKFGQGFYFAKPMNARAATDYLLGFRDNAIGAA